MNKNQLLQEEITCIEKVIQECYEYYSALDCVEPELQSRYKEAIENIERKKWKEISNSERQKYKYIEVISS